MVFVGTGKWRTSLATDLKGAQLINQCSRSPTMTSRRILLYWKQSSVCACLGFYRLRHSQVGDGDFLSESPPERTYGPLAI